MNANAPTRFPKTALLAIAALAAAAIAFSALLFYQSVTGSYSPCCGDALSSRWSHWFGIPVSAFSIALYATILSVSLPGVARKRPALTAAVLRGGSILAVGAGIWFASVLISQGEGCRYCFATHACGLAIAALVLVAVSRHLPDLGAAPYGIAVFALVGFVAGSQLSPQPDPTISGAGSDSPPGSDARPTDPDQREIPFARDMVISLDQFPHVGPDRPKIYLAELFDYTCSSCREMHGDLAALKEAYPGTFTVIYLPCPLNRKCNAFLGPAVHDHDEACELSRVALALWNAAPERFPEFHDAMMTGRTPPTPTEAEAKAISLIGRDAFLEAQRSPAVEAAIATATGHYATITQNPAVGTRERFKMPKLLLGDGAAMHGAARSKEVLVDTLAKYFQLPTPD